MKLGIDPGFELKRNEKRRGLKILVETNTIPQNITTLSDLTSALSEGERTTFGKILSTINLSLEELQEVQSWSKDCYTRNCIIDTEKYELILICWGPKQVTPIHDHGGEECWVAFIDGNFKETIFTQNSEGNLLPSKVAKVAAGEVTYMIDFMGYHKLENMDDTRSMSLHLYAKPIRNCNVYDEEMNRIVNKKLEYTTIQ